MTFPKTSEADDWYEFADRIGKCLAAYMCKTGKLNSVLGKLRHYAHSIARGIECRLAGDIITAQTYERAADFWYKNLPPKVQSHCCLRSKARALSRQAGTLGICFNK